MSGEFEPPTQSWGFEGLGEGDRKKLLMPIQAA